VELLDRLRGLWIRWRYDRPSCDLGECEAPGFCVLEPRGEVRCLFHEPNRQPAFIRTLELRDWKRVAEREEEN